MFVLAVTGGLGAGKSTAAAFFASRGAEVLDADAIAKALLEPDAPAYAPVVARFGQGVLAEDGRIDRRALAAAAFGDPRSSADLDAIVHPLVTREIERVLDGLAARAVPPAVVVIDVPLLAEAPELVDLVDLVLLITAPEDVRLSRVARRGGMSEKDARARLARQLPQEDRRALANAEIVNAGDEAALQEALASFWTREVEPRVS